MVGASVFSAAAEEPSEDILKKYAQYANAFVSKFPCKPDLQEIPNAQRPLMQIWKEMYEKDSGGKTEIEHAAATIIKAKEVYFSGVQDLYKKAAKERKFMDMVLNSDFIKRVDGLTKTPRSDLPDRVAAANVKKNLRFLFLYTRNSRG